MVAIISSTWAISYLEVSLVLRTRLPPPVTAMELVAARGFQELGADDDIVVVRRLLRRVEGRRQLGRLKGRLHTHPLRKDVDCPLILPT